MKFRVIIGSAINKGIMDISGIVETTEELHALRREHKGEEKILIDCWPEDKEDINFDITSYEQLQGLIEVFEQFEGEHDIRIMHSLFKDFTGDTDQLFNALYEESFSVIYGNPNSVVWCSDIADEYLTEYAGIDLDDLPWIISENINYLQVIDSLERRGWVLDTENYLMYELR